MEEESEEMEEVRSCEEVMVSLIGLKVVAIEPFDAIVGLNLRCARKEGSEWECCGRKGCSAVLRVSPECQWVDPCERDRASAQRSTANHWSSR